MINSVCTLLALASVSAVHLEHGFENTNIAVYDETSRLSDYNRFRADLGLTHQDMTGFSVRIILDNESRSRERPWSLTNEGKVYRGYLKYEGEKSRIVLGRQRVPFGVGRLWNPIDVFNPVDSLSLETGERVGTESLRYEYALSDLSGIDLTVSRHKNAARVKGFLGRADVAAVSVVDYERDRSIVGWEIAGEMPGTAVEFRSEGGHFTDRNTGDDHSEFIAGIERGFASSLTLLAEYYFNDETKVDHLGWRATYEPAFLWGVGFLQIFNVVDGSSVSMPSLTYSVSDEMTVSAGVFLFTGDDTDEYGEFSNRYYLQYYVHF